MKLDRFINRPVLSTVISVLIVILGIIGLATLPVTQYPDIAPPTVQVRATYTGANSTAVLNSVIAPLEDQINGVENMIAVDLYKRLRRPAESGEKQFAVFFAKLPLTFGFVGTDTEITVVLQRRHIKIPLKA